MSAKNSDRTRWRRKKSPKNSIEEDNDCASLAWLLNFRLDEIVNVKVPDDEVEEPKEVVENHQVPRKPPYTYPELIERALRENGELTVSAIYQWISDRFPFYKANDERWKNSVRHNLSINPHFRKGARAPQGAGHLWSLAANAIDLLPLRNIPVEENVVEINQGTKLLGFPKVIVLDEAAIAAASILPDQDIFSGSTNTTAQLLKAPRTHLTAPLCPDNGFSKTVLKCAFNIAERLNGAELFVKGAPIDLTVFLNPVSTEQVVRECGLITVD